ncbi:sulfite exporter TauE/SafE family protein [Hugenholtzia roseola]|uniref:sulfite exporter TauE/SafE family protein n=1 Tax=Hugenholtzia roseola TaxID=1002 RepID=UPI000686A447|nr:sulfite exporter TauE/SafE family protein [Hugenholtzia roseola]
MVIWSAFLLGLLGSTHCLGMCAPLVLAFGKSNNQNGIFSNLLYNLGRLLTYTSMGLVVGWIGKAVLFAEWQPYVAVLMGLLMVLIGIFSINLDTWVAKLSLMRYLFAQVQKGIGAVLKQKTQLFSFLFLGVLNGFLPCGLVYMGLMGAVAAGDSTQGALYMLFFGLGTFPLMMTAFFLGNRLSQQWRKRLRQIYPFAFVGLGLWLMYIGYQSYLNILANPTSIEDCH